MPPGPENLGLDSNPIYICMESDMLEIRQVMENALNKVSPTRENSTTLRAVAETLKDAASRLAGQGDRPQDNGADTVEFLDKLLSGGNSQSKQKKQFSQLVPTKPKSLT